MSKVKTGNPKKQRKSTRSSKKTAPKVLKNNLSVSDVQAVDRAQQKAEEQAAQIGKEFSSSKKVSVGSSSTIKRNRILFGGAFDRLVGEKKELSKYWKVVSKAKALEKEYKKLTDTQLKAKTQYFRDQFKGLEGKEIQKKLDEILPEAFATVREASGRAVGMRHFSVQMIGAMVLNEGRIAEMKTGEGKTLVATLSVYLNALPTQSQIHVVTVNDYLARRDASWMGRIYDYLGLTVGVIQNQSSFYFKLGEGSSAEDKKRRSAGLLETYEDGEKEDAKTVLDVENLVPCDRKRAYWIEDQDKPVDIVYGVNSEFGFDYLRDNMAKTPQEINQRAGHYVAVVDEVDSILIDEARTPLIISSQDADSSEQYEQFSKIVARLNPLVDYNVDEKRKIVNLTDLGIEKVERSLGIENLYGSEKNVVLIHHLDQALRARALFKKDKDYVIKDNEIVIVDENTGRMMVGRRYNQGLHQAIEAKEGVQVKAESKTVASITFQNYFRLYKKLSGMTGTAATESEELFKIYKLLVVSIPTNRDIKRRDYVDRIFKSEKGKFAALARDIKEIHSKGQPILVGTTSIEKNALLSSLLTKIGVPHEVLNAKNHEQEARIISNAGRKGSVTIATNIAGRGVDIKLGGEVPEDEEGKKKWQEEHDEIKSLGGLFVIGTERHESRRIDNQLRGRAGRQGDPGESRFYISLQDYILRVFGGDKISYYNILPVAEDEPIENKLLSKLVEQAQKKIEGQNYDIRKHVTDYDDVINRQRSVIYSRRQKVLLNEGFDWQKDLQKAIYKETLRSLRQVQKPLTRKNIDSKGLKLASSDLKTILPLSEFDTDVIKILLKDNKYKYDKVAKILANKLINQLDIRWEIYEEYVQIALVRYIYLRAIDLLWTEHLVTIDHLNDSVRLRGYSQKDPLTEFKQDGMKLFEILLAEIDKEVSDTIFKVNPDLVPKEIMESSKKK